MTQMKFCKHGPSTWWVNCQKTQKIITSKDYGLAYVSKKLCESNTIMNFYLINCAHAHDLCLSGCHIKYTWVTYMGVDKGGHPQTLYTCLNDE